MTIIDKATAPGDFFDAADFKTLTLFDDLDKFGGTEEGIEGAGIEPRGTASHGFGVEAMIEPVVSIEIGDFEFTAG